MQLIHSFFSFLQHINWEKFNTIFNSTIINSWGIAGLMRTGSWSIYMHSVTRPQPTGELRAKHTTARHTTARHETCLGETCLGETCLGVPEPLLHKYPVTCHKHPVTCHKHPVTIASHRTQHSYIHSLISTHMQTHSFLFFILTTHQMREIQHNIQFNHNQFLRNSWWTEARPIIYSNTNPELRANRCAAQ